MDTRIASTKASCLHKNEKPSCSKENVSHNIVDSDADHSYYSLIRNKDPKTLADIYPIWEIIIPKVFCHLIPEAIKFVTVDDEILEIWGDYGNAFGSRYIQEHYFDTS